MSSNNLEGSGGSDDSTSGDDGFVDDSDGSGGFGGDDDGVINAITSWGDLELPATLTSFLSNPQGFIIGAVATAILEQVFGIVTTLINLVFTIFGGSEPGRLNAPGETLGLIDVPVYVAELLGRVGTGVGTAILLGIESLNEPVFALASNAGPATPLIITGVIVVETVVVLWLFQRIVFVLADLLQLGGLTE